jgi:hypothetical protein
LLMRLILISGVPPIDRLLSANTFIAFPRPMTFMNHQVIEKQKAGKPAFCKFFKC